jgi:chemotaxis protein CheZ
MTDRAANATMDAVDAGLPIADRLHDCIQRIMPDWLALMSMDLQVGQFKTLCHELHDLLNSTEQDANQLRSLLSDILMAQDFQDLTGQVIRKVINLVQEVENKLVEMLTMFGEQNIQQIDAAAGIEAEGPIINPTQRTDAVSGQDDVDDLLSSLGF